MRAAEFEATVMPDGRIEVAEPWRELLERKAVRVILMWPEDDDEAEQAAWQNAGLAVFAQGDGADGWSDPSPITSIPYSSPSHSYLAAAEGL